MNNSDGRVAQHSKHLHSSTFRDAADDGPPLRLRKFIINLGYAIARGSSARWGLRLMSEGVDLMRADISANGLSFLAQGLRKLEDAVRRSGDHDRAEALARDRKAIAGSTEAFDQDRSSE